MIWTIPAKTFLLGEYAALADASAIVLTTTPGFELSLVDIQDAKSLHPESPAGRLWADYLPDQALSWKDPYDGQGGMGASSAQFIGVYLAKCFRKKTLAKLPELLELYYYYAYAGTGLRPSGYDILAQVSKTCVYINKTKSEFKLFDWPFRDISFILIHTGQKLKTHHHLENLTPLSGSLIDKLAKIVDEAKLALIRQDSGAMITAINAYQEQLSNLSLQAQHSLNIINQLKSQVEVLAAKGCGALGADVILLIVKTKDKDQHMQTILAGGWSILATDENLFRSSEIIVEKNLKFCTN